MTYKFTVNDTDFEIPSFTDLPMGVIRKARKGKNDADTAFTILEMVMGEDSAELAAVDTMKPAEFEKWLSGWTQGVSVGESSSSAN